MQHGNFIQQKIFPIQSQELYLLDEFIVSSSNKIPYDIITNWKKSWGINPYAGALILHAPPSSGKTHLANIWSSISGSYIIPNSYELDLDLLSQYNGFVIEDFSTNWEETTLLHVFNTLHEYKKFLLLTYSGDLTFQLPDLHSRIASVREIKILPPDDHLMCTLIFKLFSQYSIIISSEVAGYLSKTLPREFDKIITAVNFLNYFALQNNRKITIPMIKTVFQSGELD